MTDLVRPIRGRIVAGVCAGLAIRFATSPTLVRVLFLASMLLPGPQILIYVALWVIMPVRPSHPAEVTATFRRVD